MPQVDLEILVTACAGGASERKIACETLADDDPPKTDILTSSATEAPPESFLLPKDAEYDWFDRHAFYERKDSTRGYSDSGNLNPHTYPSSNSSSYRFSANLKSKASIIGLPKNQKTTFRETNRRICKQVNIRLFPKRSGSVGKSAALIEPGSPNVSCMGRVRSKKSRRRSNSRKRGEKATDKSRTGGGKHKVGFYEKVIGMFRSKKAQKKPTRSGSRKLVEVVTEKPAGYEQMRRSRSVSASAQVREIAVGEAPVVEGPGLGGLRRFASGRRSGSWASDDFSQAVAGDLGRREVRC